MIYLLFLKLKLLLVNITNIIMYPTVGLEQNFLIAPIKTLLLCCLVIFLETGCILFPFLPGDIFLTLIGSILKDLGMGITLPIFFLSFSAFIGTQFNYFVGYFLGNKLNRVFCNNENYNNNIKKAAPFIKKYGILSVFLSRWCGWLRTFIPFISGTLRIPFYSFTICSFLSAFIWVISFIGLGACCQPFKNFIGAFMSMGFLLAPMLIIFYSIFYSFRKFINYLYSYK